MTTITCSRGENIPSEYRCCPFSELLNAAERLREHDPDVTFVESVGSCIDLSATVLQPLKQLYGGNFRLSPYTVLVDPARANELLTPNPDPHLSYLFSIKSRTQTSYASVSLMCIVIFR